MSTDFSSTNPDPQTFTRTTENAQLGHGFVVMSGGKDVHESTLEEANEFCRIR